MTLWIIVGVVLSIIIICCRQSRAYTYHDGPYMTQDGWKHSYSEELDDGNWATETKSYRRDDPWRD